MKEELSFTSRIIPILTSNKISPPKVQFLAFQTESQTDLCFTLTTFGEISLQDFIAGCFKDTQTMLYSPMRLLKIAR